MADITTKYMGLTLKNPVVVGASNLVTDPGNLKKMEDSGAAAIVYKSLFEEQIQLENLEIHESLTEYEERHAEMVSLFPEIEHAGPEEYLINLRKAKESVSVPVIASLNAVYKEAWIEYAKQIEQTGVDGLELNFYNVPDNFETEGTVIEAKQIEIAAAVKQAVKIPVSVKLSQFYTNPLRVISDLDKVGVDGFVLLNRLFHPDLDLSKEEHHFPYNLSNHEDNRMALRFTGLVYGNVNASVCSNTGIFTGNDVAKMILAGADCVQVVSTLYKNQISYIKNIIADLEAWMQTKNYQSIADFKGKLSKKNAKDRYAYKRAQYIDILMRSNEIFKKYPML